MNQPKTTIKTMHQLRKGDIVRCYGGRFLVTSELRESQAHRPEGYWPDAGVGPSACVVCDAICLEGNIAGYFKPGSPWTFQGNHHATESVEV